MPPQRKLDKSRSRQASGRPVSRESTLSRASTTGKGVNESAVLTDGSLAILAREIGAEKTIGLVLCMYLNIPNTTIVNATNEASDTGLLGVSDTLVIEATQRLLLTWKVLRAGSKEKDKVKALERALREMGKPDIADAINHAHANNCELTKESLNC